MDIDALIPFNGFAPEGPLRDGDLVQIDGAVGQITGLTRTDTSSSFSLERRVSRKDVRYTEHTVPHDHAEDILVCRIEDRQSAIVRDLRYQESMLIVELERARDNVDVMRRLVQSLTAVQMALLGRDARVSPYMDRGGCP
jgi:hypothetical protein